MSIWHSEFRASDLNENMGRGTINQHLGIEFVEAGDDYLKATMPVDHRTRQPMGLLHGGANVVLAESLGSAAGTLCIDFSKQACVGIEVNANHLKSVTEGKVTGIARPLHLGRRTQVWEIKIYNEQEALCCVSRLTLAVVDHKRS